MEPRVVLVTRPTAYEELLASHGTHRQAEWFLDRQGQALGPLRDIHTRQAAAVAALGAAVPAGWRQTRITRKDLDRFLFEPEDLVVPIGPDGLVANVAKYLHGQRVIGINPDPASIDGVLARHPIAAAPDLLRDAGRGRSQVEHRTMVEARTDDGQVLRALNEVFVGHRSHQSSRYRIRAAGREERQSSSGLIVATGTGSTGWALSIARSCGSPFPLPAPTDPALVFFVREPWPSRTTGATVVHGRLTAPLQVVSEMNDGGVLFGDGIEEDAIPLPFARRVTVQPAEQDLVLVV